MLQISLVRERYEESGKRKRILLYECINIASPILQYYSRAKLVWVLLDVSGRSLPMRWMAQIQYVLAPRLGHPMANRQFDSLIPAQWRSRTVANYE